MNSFKRLKKVTLTVVLLVLLLNFGGLFYLSLRSNENENREELEKLSESQQKTSLRISQHLVRLVNNRKADSLDRTISKDLIDLLNQFKKQQELIGNQIIEYSFSETEQKHHFNESSLYFAAVIEIAEALTDPNTSYHSQLDHLLRLLNDNEHQYLIKMAMLAQDFRDAEEELDNIIFYINYVLLTTLIVSLIVLGLMVISPVLKQGVKHYAELQTSLNEVTKSKVALQKKDLLLEGVSHATQELIGKNDLNTAIGEAIKRFAVSINADEVNIHKNEVDDNGILFSRQLACYKSATEELKYWDAEYQHIPFEYMPWTINELCEKNIFYKSVQDLKEPARTWFENKQILSIVTIPVFASGCFWGFLNIFDAKEVRQWQQTELSILLSLATTLGAVIERNQLQASLVGAKEIAEASSKAKSEFMSNMSHELRTPMNSIIGFTDLVLTTNLSAHQKECLGNVRKSGYNLLNIINDILDFSKIEANKIILDPAPFQLNELVEETAEILSLTALEKNLEIVCKIDPSLPSQFMGDAARIKQILINLIGNAIKFTKTGTIIVQVKSEGTIYQKKNGKYINTSIEVTDTGIGIPADKIHVIFENFTQADSTTTRKYGGTGLGLTISMGLANLMSGTIDVQSEEGKGSTFSLKLPLEVLNEKPHIIFPKRPVLNQVLIIDDHPLNCSLLKGVFDYLEIPSTICYSGYEALAELAKARTRGDTYDLIITDHQMPGMDGLTLVKKIKAQFEDDAEPFILMLSSLDKSTFQQEAESIGINKFLSKPVKISQLSDIISKIFDNPVTEIRGSMVSPSMEETSSANEVMVVENEPMNMLLISTVLRNMGISVLESGNGSHAMQLLEKHSPAMIFMDVNMPDLDGLDVTRMIRKLNGRKSEIPIVALTADAMKEDRERCIDAGMNDYVSKPFSLQDITMVVDKYISQQCRCASRKTA